MEYKARHNQPFTLEQAIMLEVPVITTEIARLQNSLTHLRNTQQQLRESVDSEQEPDLEILQALKENEEVIGSQEERISMLRLALEHKGLAGRANPHYELPHSADSQSRRIAVINPGDPTDSSSEGVFL